MDLQKQANKFHKNKEKTKMNAALWNSCSVSSQEVLVNHSLHRITLIKIVQIKNKVVYIHNPIPTAVESIKQGYRAD